MKAIMVMFDSLNRHMLPPYGCDWTHAPNFQRLGKNADLRYQLCLLDALHAGPSRFSYRPAQFSAPVLGAIGAL